MISVILATRDDETALAHALAALVPAAADGLLREAIIVDGGSRDGTALVADAAGCRFIAGEGVLGRDLARGAAAARSDWLLFLSPHVLMEPAWQREVSDFIERVRLSGDPRRVGIFRGARAAFGVRPRLAEMGAALRLRCFAAPYLEEGLLISARFYRELGGHRDGSDFVDVDLARRIGRRRMSCLRARAFLRSEGAPPQRGNWRLALFLIGLLPRRIGSSLRSAR